MASISGFVALIDVLGFAKLVLTRRYAPALGRYRECIATAAPGGDDVSYLVFSDTVVLYTPLEGPKPFWQLTVRTGRLFRELLMEGFPIRGAMSFGEFEMADAGERGVVLAGPALEEAHDYEQKQNWIGVLIAPSVLESLGTEISDWSGPGLPQTNVDALVPWKHLVHHAQVPFHGMQESYDGIAVLPVSSSSRDKREVAQELQQAKKMLLRMKSLAPDPEAQAKYKASLEWFDEANRTIQGI